MGPVLPYNCTQNDHTPIYCKPSHKHNSLGLRKKQEYDKVTTHPIEWFKVKGKGVMFFFETHAWLDGKRYTVKGPVYVSGGKYIPQ